MAFGSDPRHYQIAVLTGLLTWGVGFLDFDVSPARIAAVLATTLGTQAVCTRLFGLPSFDFRSPLISGLSLSVLLRTDVALLAPLGAFVAIASKFVIRRRGKHVFNPTNLALAVLLLVSDRTWVSPGQWGSAAFFAFLLAGFGGLVIHRAARSDVTWAFLAAWAAIVLGRALWLGDPWAIPLHQLRNGAVLLFAFLMISDPKTTPDSRAGRILFAALVALGAGFVQFVLFRNNGLIASLVCCSTLVPLIDRLLPGRRYEWGHSTTSIFEKEKTMRRFLVPLALLGCITLLAAPSARAFCGFYVAKADTKLFNRASQVAIVRHDDKTVITMANDFQGDLTEFAVVIPVPTFLEREQIHVGDRALIEHLDAWSSPRLVEYFDPDPCARHDALRKLADLGYAAAPAEAEEDARRREGLGVRIDARYTVGEYDILLLSAEQSSGLTTWLRENGYRLPDGAESILRSYLKQGMRFFVAKVNLDEQARLGFQYLRPLQIAFESPKFMLPIRLGTLNADGPQELFAYLLTRNGRVETTNYRTVKLPTDTEIPVMVKDDFASFYRDMFSRQVERERMAVVFLEYAWNMAGCDPCASDPLSADELQQLGVFWLDDTTRSRRGQDVFLTRLHVRYDSSTFPADLVFQETGDRTNWQARYVLRHTWDGDGQCSQAKTYRAGLPDRWEREVGTLANLTGWDPQSIRRRMRENGQWTVAVEDGRPWWKRLWN